MRCCSRPKRLFSPVIGSSSSSTVPPLQTGPTEAGRRYRPGCRAVSYTGDRVKVTSTGALFARVVGELDERGSRSLGRQHKRGKIEPGDLAMAPQVDPLRVDAGHPPVSAAAAKQAFGVILDRLRVIRVHMSQDPRLCRSKPACVSREQQIAALDPVDPAKTGDEVPAFDRDPIEA